ncbi:MAG: nucleotidyltransferase family protein [Alphaproteobacteria bacterium]|nr:nucleotidyltransferase family protein [Alphaproteobacteria bacterium]
MKDITSLCLPLASTVKDGIAQINKNGKKCVFIVDDAGRLCGLMTDGDVRRYVLSGKDLNASVTCAMNPKPVVFHQMNEKKLKQEMSQREMLVYPVVDANNRLIDAFFWNDLPENRNGNISGFLPDTISTVIMAGGLGRRLYPYTKVLPKALVPIGEDPICTHVINNFKSFGCKDFHLILNHKKEMIKAYYSDVEKDYNLTFHEEKEFLGTAGGLSLLKGKMDHAFFVSNCDILVEADYPCIYKTHKSEGNLITMVGALKDIQIPYGVIKLDHKNVTALEEKPKFSFLTNVGVYLLEPSVLDDIKDGVFIHMTDLIERYIAQGKKVGCFPIAGDAWLDMGQIEEMKKMTAVLERRVQDQTEQGE